jgi:hypothetical protein
MNRREFLLGVSAVCSACTSLAAAQVRLAADGCGLVSGFGSLSDHTSRSGNPQLDRALIAEVRKLDREFRISPGYRFLRDGDQPNAYATSDTVVEGTQGTIFFGLTLLENELQTEYGGAAIAGIAAHEGAHIVQFGSPDLAKRLASSTSKLRELHADFLAGYYFSRTGRTERSLITFGESLFAKGDYKYNDRLHHGTPQQRVAAMRAGYAAGRDDLDEAVNRGVTYVIGA